MIKWEVLAGDVLPVSEHWIWFNRHHRTWIECFKVLSCWESFRDNFPNANVPFKHIPKTLRILPTGFSCLHDFFLKECRSSVHHISFSKLQSKPAKAFFFHWTLFELFELSSLFPHDCVASGVKMLSRYFRWFFSSIDLCHSQRDKKKV